MKKIFTILLPILALSQWVISQEKPNIYGITKTKELQDKVYDEDKRNKKKKGESFSDDYIYTNLRNKTPFFSTNALDIYFSRKIAEYITGENDLNFYKSYFSASTEDGTTSVGKNIQLSRIENKINSLANVSLKTNFLKNIGIGNLLAAGKFSNDIGLSANFTFFNGGKIRFFGKSVDSMAQARNYFAKRSAIKKKSLIDEFKGSADYLAAQNQQPPFDTLTLIKNRIQKIEKEESKELIDLEIDRGNKLITRSTKEWFTLIASLSRSQYKATSDSITPPKEVYFIPLILGLKYAKFLEWQQGKLQYTLSGTIENTNRSRLLALFGDEAAATLGGEQKKDGAYWVGSTDPIWQFVFNPRILLSNEKISKMISLDLMAETRWGTFNTINTGVGLLFNLNGKKEDAPVNVEILLKVVDVYGRVNSSTTRKERTYLGINLGLPFGSILQ